ncbi:MAG: hypothetical protein AB7I79_01970 [Rhizobiaceae bacterium]
MTDISTSMTMIAPAEKSRRKPSSHSAVATLLTVASAIGQAFTMLYVAPYQPGTRGTTSNAEELQGRDPRW